MYIAKIYLFLFWNLHLIKKMIYSWCTVLTENVFIKLLQQDDDGSIGEESESEGSGDVNATTYASIDMREEVAAADRERLGSAGIKNEPVSNFMQQSLAARQRAAVSSQGVMDSTIQSKFQFINYMFF